MFPSLLKYGLRDASLERCREREIAVYGSEEFKGIN